MLTAVVAVFAATGLVAPPPPWSLAAVADSPTAITEPAEAPAAARIDIVDIAPIILQPGGGLRLTLRLLAGQQEIAAGSAVEMTVQRSPLRTRYGVARAAGAGTSDEVGSLVLRVELDRAIPTQEARTVQLSATAEQVGLAGSAPFGPRPVAVALRAVQGEVLALSRAFVVWLPDPTSTPKVAVTVLVPVTAGPPDPTTGEPDLDRLAALTQPTGRLSQLLGAAAQPGVALGVDPQLLTVDSSGATPAQATAVEGPGGPQASIAAWQRALLSVATERDTIVFPAADPDVAAVAHAETPDLLGRARRLAAQVEDAVPTSLTGVAWLPGGAIDQTTAAVVEAADAQAVVVRESQYPATTEPSLTRTGRAQLPWPAESPLQAVLADNVLSDALELVGQAHVGGSGSDGADSQARSAAGPVAVSRLAAETAVIAAQNPGRLRHLVVTAPRGWDPGVSGGREAISVLTQSAWTTPSSPTEVLAQDAANLRRVPAEGAQRWLSTENIRLLRSAGDVANRVAAAWAEPQAVLEPVRQQQLGLLSSAWRDQRVEWDREVHAFADRARNLAGTVSVVPGSQVTQVSQDVRLPVTVRNEGASPVTVFVRASPRSSRLQVIENDVRVVVPARTATVAYLPVRGVGNGDTSVRVQLVGSNGAELGEPSEITIAVRADWEHWFTGVLGALTAAVLVIGVVRTIRRQPTRAQRIRTQAPPRGQDPSTRSPRTWPRREGGS